MLSKMNSSCPMHGEQEESATPFLFEPEFASGLPLLHIWRHPTFFFFFNAIININFSVIPDSRCFLDPYEFSAHVVPGNKLYCHNKEHGNATCLVEALKIIAVSDPYICSLWHSQPPVPAARAVVRFACQSRWLPTCKSSCFTPLAANTPAAGSRPLAMQRPGCRDTALTWHLPEGLTPAASLHTPRGTPCVHVHKVSKCSNIGKTQCKLPLDTPPGQTVAAGVHLYFTAH